jgi:hypothetical protein
MKKAIEFLREKGISVSDEGVIISDLPDGIEGIALIDELENITQLEDCCYTIIKNQITKIDC